MKDQDGVENSKTCFSSQIFTSSPTVFAVMILSIEEGVTGVEITMGAVTDVITGECRISPPLNAAVRIVYFLFTFCLFK